MARNPTYMIEGEWTGYSSSQRRVAHRHYTNLPKEIEWVEKTYGIRYTDGTMLLLTATPVTGRKRLPVIDGYGSLIGDCRFYGVNSVDGLVAAREKVKAEYAAKRAVSHA